MERLVDGHGRPIGDLRVSVTDRCNFRCQYCMPAEGLSWLDHDEILRFEEIERTVALLGAMGVRDVRLTGGEPLVRRGLPQLVEMISAIPEIEEISLTTNAYMLDRHIDDLVAAGLNRINVSLDSLARDRFFQLTRRDALPQIMASLELLERYPEIRPIKVNVVALRDFTEAELLDFARLARHKPYIVRFIEFMPLDGDRAWRPEKVLPNSDVKAMIAAVYPLVPLDRESHATATRFRFAKGRGELGFVSPVSQPFCFDCNRIRLTADGRLRTCLFSLHETDLRVPLRANASNVELSEIIREAVWQKELKHQINEPGFRQPLRTMSQIGG